MREAPTNTDTGQFIIGSDCLPVGRTTIAALRRLRIGRIIGRPGLGPVVFNTLERHTALACLEGRAFVLVAEEPYELAPCEILRVPPGTSVRVDPDGNGCDVVEFSADGHFPVGRSIEEWPPPGPHESACVFIEAPPRFCVELRSAVGGRVRFPAARHDTVLVPENFTLEPLPAGAAVSFLWAAAL